MTNSRGFRPFVPTLAYPRVAAMQGRDAHAHGAAGLANPMPRDLLFTPWEALYHAPFTGITTDGVAQPGLFALGPDGKKLILVSCLDNLIKGAAGQAVQNMNVMYGWAEQEGLN